MMVTILVAAFTAVWSSNKRIEELSHRLDDTNRRLDRLESTMQEMMKMLMSIDRRLTALEERSHLAAVGIGGVVGHSVTQRTHEIGLRMALGARALDVLRLIVSGNMLWVLAGLLAGVAGSAALTRRSADCYSACGRSIRW